MVSEVCGPVANTCACLVRTAMRRATGDDARASRGHVRVALVVAMTLCSTAAAAQVVTGTIRGTVRDSSGAVVPGTLVTLQEISTGLSRTAATNDKGDYTVALLATGVYTIRLQAAGFRPTLVTGIELDVDQKLQIDAALEIGGVSDLVAVRADNALVQRASSDVSAVLLGAQIQQLPLNGRNFVQLTRTLPGVVRGVPGENIDGASALSWRQSSSFSANGARPRDNNFLLDGLDNNEIWLNSVAIFPSVDAISELKVHTGTYAAEFGRSLGGVVSLQTKSGANAFHGNAFEFLRDGRLDANDWFNNRAHRPKPDFSQHQFGGTLGGPIRRNRTFFFADYQGWRINQDLTVVSTVPSDRMRGGDFSELNRVIYDPATSLPFPGNIIPSVRIDPVARRIVDQLYPRANATGVLGATGQTINNYVANPERRRVDNQYDVRVDHVFGQANRAFVRYSQQNAWRLMPPALPSGDGGSSGAGTFEIGARSIAFNDTQILGPQWLNELRIGWNAIDLGFVRVGNDQQTAEQMGIAGINLDAQTGGMTTIDFATQDMRAVGSGGGPGTTNTSALQLTDNVIHVRGRQTLKAGGGLILRRRYVYSSDNPLGLFGHNANFTSNCAGRTGSCTLDSNTGFAFAGFMLGDPFVFNRARIEAPYTERRPEWSAYVQDDVRAGDRVTLNLGLRWDLFVPYVEDHDQQSNFDTSTGRFVVAAPDATIGGVRVGRYLQTYSKTDFAPRLGFAYDVRGNGGTMLRGGFGTFWNTPLTGTASSKAQNPPFLLSQALSNPLPFVPVLSFSSAAAQPTPQTGGNSRSSFDANFRDGYAHQWSINVQQQLGANYMVEVGYVGSRARQLVVLVDVNQAPAQLGVTNSNVNRPFFGVNPTLASVAQSQSAGTLDYRALLTRVVRRFADGLWFSSSYTCGRAIDLSSDTDGPAAFPNSYDLGYNRGPANYDVTHVWTSAWTWALPFLRTGTFGGWQLSGLLLARSGYPFSVFQSQNPQSTLTGTSPGLLYRPDTIRSGVLTHPTIDRWFDTTAFVAPSEPTATFGNSGRNSLRGPGQFTVDAAVAKLTTIGRVQTEIRFEAFNLFNHPVFANPASTIGSANAGTISSLMPFTPMRQLQIGLKIQF